MKNNKIMELQKKSKGLAFIHTSFARAQEEYLKLLMQGYITFMYCGRGLLDDDNVWFKVYVQTDNEKGGLK